MNQCMNCISWKSDKAMTPLGLANCEYLPKWTFLPPHGHCTKWMPQDADKAKSIEQWLKDKGLIQ